MPRRGIDLTEEQWRLAKTSAAARGLTLSQFFAEFLDSGVVGKPIETPSVPERTPEQVATGKQFNHQVHDALASSTRTPYDEFRPVPKPSQKGKRK